MRILMVGPDRSVQGGISGVVNNYYRAGLDKKVQLHYIGTMVDGKKVKKLIKALQSYIRFALCVSKYDIIHVNMAADASYYRKIYFICVSKLFHKKLIIHQHGGDVEHFFDSDVKGIRRKIRYKILDMADAFLVLAPIWKDFFGNIIPKEKIYVLPNGIEVPKYDVSKKDYSDCNIAYIGRICREKGIQELYDAVETLKQEFPSIHLYLGGKWESEELHSIQKDKDEYISYLGWLGTEQKKNILQKCSVFVMPSYFEGQCIAVLEAMSYGCATIATRVGGLQQTFCDGEDGVLIEPQSAGALIKALRNLLLDEQYKRKVGTAGRNKVKSKFDIQTIMEQLLEIYRNM